MTSFSEARPVLLELCETVTKRLRADHVLCSGYRSRAKRQKLPSKISPDRP
ncbi:MAG: hypothetical protein ACLTS6_06315 [Anaerobutyricum sp.]